MSAATSVVETKAQPRTPEEIAIFFHEKAVRDNDTAIQAVAAAERKHREVEAQIECATIETTESDLRDLVQRREVLALRVGHARTAQVKAERAIEYAQRRIQEVRAEELRKLSDVRGVEPIIALERQAIPLRAELARIDAEQERLFRVEVAPRQPFFQRLLAHQAVPEHVLEDVAHIRRMAGLAPPLDANAGLSQFGRDALARVAAQTTQHASAEPSSLPEFDFRISADEQALLRDRIRAFGAGIFSAAGCPYACSLGQLWRLAGGEITGLVPVAGWAGPDVDLTDEWLKKLLRWLR